MWFDDEAMEALLRGKPPLVSLNVSGCRRVTDRSGRRLGEERHAGGDVFPTRTPRFPYLRLLDLTHCVGIETETGIHLASRTMGAR
jgi:hypothetical protein